MAEACGIGDHRGVIGTEDEGGSGEGGTCFGTDLHESGADSGIGGDTACDNDVLGLSLLNGGLGFAGEECRYGVLERGGDVGGVGLRVFGEVFADGGFEAGEGESQRIVGFGVREGDGFGITGGGEFFDGRACRMGEAQKFADLVEAFADGVIGSRAEGVVVARLGDVDELGVAAGDQEQQVGLLVLKEGFGEGGGILGQQRRESVAFDMVGGQERFTQAHGHGFGKSGADHQCGGEAGADGGGDGVDVGPLQAAGVQGVLGEGGEALEVRAGGDFGHDTAVGGVFGDLGIDMLGENTARGNVHDGRGGFVAGGFDRKDAHGRVIGVNGIGVKGWCVWDLPLRLVDFGHQRVR